VRCKAAGQAKTRALPKLSTLTLVIGLLALAGCGSSASGTSSSTSDAARAAATPTYRWLVPTTGPSDDLAETTIYTARSGAIVFDTGTMGWELGLEPVPSASPDAPLAPDPRVVAMTGNVLARVLRRSSATG
jgi:hypothetical protein